jgi:hypothetical protein
MLSTEKINQAFKAICEEAENLKNESDASRVAEGLAQIISIAKHQNDVRGSKSGSCKAHAES